MTETWHRTYLKTYLTWNTLNTKSPEIIISVPIASGDEDKAGFGALGKANPKVTLNSH